MLIAELKKKKKKKKKIGQNTVVNGTFELLIESYLELVLPMIFGSVTFFSIVLAILSWVFYYVQLNTLIGEVVIVINIFTVEKALGTCFPLFKSQKQPHEIPF